MSLDCPPAELLFRLAEPELFDDPAEAREVAERAEGCPDCQTVLRRFESELAAPPLPFDPIELLPDLRSRLAERAAPAPEASGVELRLLCAYCRDGLRSTDALYCASCLTPHHGECYAEHGRCVAPGCESVAVVGARQAPTRPPRPRRVWRAGLGLLGLVGVGAIAAWAPTAFRPADLVAASPPSQAGERPSRVAPNASPEDEGEAAVAPLAENSLGRLTLKTYPVGDLVKTVATPRPAWELRYRELLRSRRVTLNFPNTPLSEVVGFLRDITGLNLTLAQELDLEREISLRLKDILLTDALDLIAAGGKFRWSLVHGTIYLQPVLAGQLVSRPVNWPLEEQATQSEGAALLEILRAATLETLGESGWEEPARVSVRSGTLRVVQTPAGHQAVVAFLATRRLSPPPAALQGTWFAPRAPNQLPPALARARLHAQELLGEVSLSVEGSLSQALARLAQISRTPIRVDPGAAELVATRFVELSLRGVTRRDALNLICAAAPGLVWEVDRRGVLIRPSQATPLETRLREGAQRAADRSSTEHVRERLGGFPVTLRFPAETATGGEVIDFLRDLSGLNFVVSQSARSALEPKIAALHVSKIPLGEALEALLTPLGLGYDLSQGVVRIVPAVEASEGTALEALRARLLATPLSTSDLRGVDLYTLARKLEAACGVSVVLDEGLIGARARVFLPAGLTLAQALELLRPQAGIEAGLAWLPSEQRFVLGLRWSEGVATLAGCLALLDRPCPWTTPPDPIQRAWEESQAALLESLTKLGEADSASLAPRLEAVLGQGRAAIDRYRCYSALGSSEGQEARRKAATLTADLVARVLKDLALLDLAKAKEGEARKRDAASEDDLRAREHAAAISKEAGGAERRARQEAAGLRERDHDLMRARLASVRGSLEQRLAEVCLFPERLAEDANLRHRLAEGEAFAGVFPQGYRRAEKAASGKDFAAYRLGVAYVAAGEEGPTFRSRRLAPNLRPGDRLISVNWKPIPTSLALVKIVSAGLLRVDPGKVAVFVVEVERGSKVIRTELRLRRPQAD